MNVYTVDAVALLHRLGGREPQQVTDLFEKARQPSAEIVLELPHVAAAEVLYIIQGRPPSVAGSPLSKDADDVARAVATSIPVSVVGGNSSDVVELADWAGAFPSQVHDAMILSSHTTRDTEAIVTDDSKIDDHADTIWS